MEESTGEGGLRWIRPELMQGRASAQYHVRGKSLDIDRKQQAKPAGNKNSLLGKGDYMVTYMGFHVNVGKGKPPFWKLLGAAMHIKAYPIPHLHFYKLKNL